MGRWLVFLCVLGCTRQNGVSSCVVGEQHPCLCLGGASGEQVCLDDRSYGGCICFTGPDGGRPDGAGSDGSFADGSGGNDGGLGGGDAGEDLSVGDLASADLAFADLLAAPDLRAGDLGTTGVECVSAVCTGGQVCCLNGSSMSGSCASTCANSSFACDGPEDCPPGDSCCVDVTGSGSALNGSASCAASCTGAYTSLGGSTVREQSQLCHADSDCTNISGDVLGLGPFAFSSCCHSANTAPYHVCIPGGFAATEGFTCP